MAILDIARGQQVTIPAIQLTNGKIFTGSIRASDGESLMIDLHERAGGSLPSRTDEMVILVWESDGVQRSCPIIVRSNTPRSLVAQVVIQERREAPRVRIDMDLEYEKVPPAKVKEIAEEVMARANTLGEPQSESIGLMRNEQDQIAQLGRDVQQLREMLNEVLSRLDILTALACGAKADDETQAGARRQPLHIMNISSTGVGFIGKESLRSGDYLHLSMTIHSTPRAVVDCMGVVVRCLPIESPDPAAPARFDVGIHFTHIHETDRERLIQYLFKVQRRLLRDLKERRMAMAENA